MNGQQLMYPDRVKNIPVFRGCEYHCYYCAFSKMLRLSPCPMCKSFTPHSHIEVLSRTPPKTKDGEFLTVGLSSDISFMDVNNFCDVLDYCSKWGDRTFLIQSKNPAWFLQFAYRITSNVIIGTTIESNIGAWWYKEQEMFQHLKKEDRLQIHYNNDISKAPLPIDRYEAMVKLHCRKGVTIEPILDFDVDILLGWIKDIAPEFCYIGYANDKQEGKKLKLPEPALSKTHVLIGELRDAGIVVREKTLREAWYE